MVIAALAEYNANPYDLSKRKLTYTEVYEKYCQERYLNKNTPIPNPYVAAFNRSKSLHQMLFIDIRTGNIQDAIDSCDKGYASKKNVRVLASLLFKYAMPNDLVDKNYAELAALPPQENSTKHKPFSADELALLWRAEGDLGAQFALIYSYTGLRPTELLRIKTENVFLKDRYMMGGMKTAAEKNRAIPIAEKIYPFIATWYNPANEYLVTIDNEHVSSYNKLRKYWERSPVLRSMDHLPHDGRHTCSTMLNNVGVPEVLIQKILGHAGKNITQKVYTHKTLKQLIDTINLI